MKRLIFLLVFLPAWLPAQTAWWMYDTLAPRTTHIALPATKHDNPFDGREFIITRDADYKALFADSVQSVLPEIDFTRYELQAKRTCMQCMITCDYRPQCHRNACQYSRRWLLVEKQWIAWDADSLGGGTCHALPGFARELTCYDDSCFSDLRAGCPDIKNDTVSFTSRIVVARELEVDCAARIEHEFYLDTIQRCLVWRLYVDEGVCQSMDKRSYIFSLPKPPEGYVVRFERYSLPVE